MRVSGRTVDVGAETCAAAINGEVDAEGRARLRLHDGVELPSTERELDGTAGIVAEQPAVTEGHIGEHAGGEHVPLIERGVALVESVVVGVQIADGIEAEIAVGVVDVV